MFITEYVYNCFCLNVENCHIKFDLYMYIHVLVYIICTAGNFAGAIFMPNCLQKKLAFFNFYVNEGP